MDLRKATFDTQLQYLDIPILTVGSIVSQKAKQMLACYSPQFCSYLYSVYAYTSC